MILLSRLILLLETHVIHALSRYLKPAWSIMVGPVPRQESERDVGKLVRLLEYTQPNLLVQ